MSHFVLGFNEINNSKFIAVGGKGLNLGILSKIEGLKVPDGFCITTDAYSKVIEENEEFHKLVNQLEALKADDKDKISKIGRSIRKVIENSELTEEIEHEITDYILRLGKDKAYAIRSSATAEDLPTASFAGQQDTFLNIIGMDAILYHVKKCWASLYTDRAIIYRIQNGFEHRKVLLCVVIQAMIYPQVSGIMFTADPASSNRRVLTIDAGLGLGEALVSGLVNSDLYRVREGKIIDKKIAVKKLAIYENKEGGTVEREIETKLQNIQALSDKQIINLETIGRNIEKYFNCPQDIEWCLSDREFYILQSRPITTLYPIPENDGKQHVYFSMGHLQMMTEDIKPLGISFCKLLSFWFGENLTPAGGRLYIDGTYDLSSPIGRKILITSAGNADVLMKNALVNLMKRKGYIKGLPGGKGSINMSTGALSWLIPAFRIYQKDEKDLLKRIIVHNDKLIEDMEQEIKNKSGDELFEFILQDIKELKKTLVGPENMSIMLVGGYVSNWINKKMEKWLGAKSVVDTLTKSVSYNVTSEMGFALMDAADVIRQFPKVIEYFHHAKDESFFDELIKLEGGDMVKRELNVFLKKYGMRCSGEIDITKPRWNEKPTSLIPMILNNINSFGPNYSSSKFEQGKLEAEAKEMELINSLKRLPGGKQKAKKTRKMIHTLRNVIGFREYPKYSFIKRFDIYKKALGKEADLLVKQGIIKEREDIYYLTLEEFRKAVNHGNLDYQIIIKRKEDYEIYKKLTPPRVITSEGEIISGEYDTGTIPQGALVGIPVSSGVIEGRARVILKLEDAVLDKEDILVTAFTDPSWTPLFVSVKGLVTEVGGLMTHGAVITREYGLPGVVGVENATKLIQDGARIRVNGTEGYVEILKP